MPLSQVLWSLDQHQQLDESLLISEHELEDALNENIGLLNQNWLIIGRQVKTKNGKILDLLCIDRDEDLVIVELKKDLTPREVTAQVIEYASYISELENDELGRIYHDYSEKYLDGSGSLDTAYHQKFGADFDSDQLNQNTKMVIVAPKMDNGTEHIIRYLRNKYNVDINILFFNVYKHGTDRILSRAWLEEDMEESVSPPPSVADWNGEYYVSFGGPERKWEDAVKYGFISAGGGSFYSKTLNLLHTGDRIWVNIPKKGYVGVGEVTGGAVQASNAKFMIDGRAANMSELALKGKYFYSENDPENAEYVVPVKWNHTVPENRAVKEVGFFGNQNSVCRPTASKWTFTIDRLKKIWNIT